MYNLSILMVKFLNISGFIWAGGVALGLFTGYLTGLGSPLTWHVFIGLIASLGAIMTLSVDMFYFITTGSHIKDAAQKKLVSLDDYKKTRKYKSSLFPLILGGISLFIILPALGAAYDTGTLEIYYHSACAWAAVLIYIYSVRRIGKALSENREIFGRTVEKVNAEAERLRRESGKKKKGPESQDE